MIRYLYQETSGLPLESIRTSVERLVPYAERLRGIVASGKYEEPESSLNLPSDERIISLVEQTAREIVGSGVKYIIVIGIGGSNLGTKAVYDTFYGAFDMLELRRMPKMLFADTPDPEQIARFIRFIETEIERPEEVIVNVVSKSGTNTEPIANAEIIMAAMQKKFGNKAVERLAVTTDEGSKLWEIAERRGFLQNTLPKAVGGRYSVLSTVGLFPLACAGIDIHALLAGARHVCDTSLGPDLLSSEPALSAAVLAGNVAAGRGIHDTFIFHPELESFGRWYRQLLAESIGKAKNRKGEEVHAGITPTVSIGSTDLHSVGQLYFEGPRDKFTTFVWSENDGEQAPMASSHFFPGLVSHIAGRSANEIMGAIRQGVRIAYKNTKLPFAELMLADLSAKTIGAALQFKMLEVMYLGELLDVNAFDQPGVEAYKKETHRILRGDKVTDI